MTPHRVLLTSLAVSLFLIGMSLTAAPPPKDQTIDGTVLQAGQSRMTLQSSSNSAIRQFPVAPEAMITRDGMNVKLEEVHQGDFALVTLRKSENEPVATVIVALSPLRGTAEQR